MLRFEEGTRHGKRLAETCAEKEEGEGDII